MPKENTNIKERTRIGLKEPGKYNVVFHNDDFTPMEFVVMILVSVFHKDYPESERLMMKVHTEGYAIVGSYSYDIAITKASAGVNIARDNGYPLRISVSGA